MTRSTRIAAAAAIVCGSFLTAPAAFAQDATEAAAPAETTVAATPAATEAAAPEASVAAAPTGGVAAGGGFLADDETNTTPFVVAGVAALGAAGVFAARRRRKA